MRPHIAFNKIAEITLGFWAAKVVATTLGETAGDFFAQTLGFGYVGGFLLTTALLLLALVLQIRSRAYNSALFWAAVVGTTTAGTEISDMMDRTFAFGYVLGSSLLFVGLIVTLGAWYARKRSISVDPVMDKEGEVFFWVAVVFSNSLGTAFGDALIDPIGLTFVQGALVCAGAIAVLLLLHRYTRVNAALLFWGAFIFTRPFGATFGNVLTKEHERGGLELGTLQTSLVALALLALIVAASDRLDGSRQVLAERA